MNRHESLRHRTIGTRGSEHAWLAAAAGDRGADVLATRARWEATGSRYPLVASEPPFGSVRRWLGTLLARLGTRLHEPTGEAAVGGVPAGAAGARWGTPVSR